MKYQLVFSPDLEVDVKAFTEQWNSSQSCRELATAQLEKPSHAQFDPLAEVAVAVLGELAVGIAGSVLYDAIREFFRKERGIAVDFEFQKLELPRESELLVIRKALSGPET